MISIFGININDQGRGEVKQILEHFLSSDGQYHIATVNPEMLVSAKRHPEFLRLLRNVHLAVADGFGLQLVTFGKIKKRVTGSDILKILLSIAYSQKKKVYFLGGAGEQARLSAAKIQERLPGLPIAADAGGLIARDDSWFMHPSVLQSIQDFAPDLLVVGLGHEKQEFFIHDFLPQLPSVKIAVGVGGVFAFLSGQIKRAPKIFQRLGLEWLWRLVREPYRLGRIFTAVVVFPIIYFYDKLRSESKK